ncbi:MAG: S1 family peptidase [Armatimonadota bacterium]
MKWYTTAATVLCLCAIGQAQAQELTVAQMTRQLVGSKSAAIVRIETVLEYSFEGDQGTTQEENNEGVATVVDPSGLALVNYELIAYNQIDEDMGPKSVKLISASLKMTDGTEIPVEVVAKDAELGLALVRPKTPLAKPSAMITFDTGVPVVVGDVLLTVSRMDASAKYAVNVLRMTVCSVFENPRPQYIFEEGSDDALPVFTLKGDCVGMTIGIATSGANNRNMMNGMHAATEIVKFLNKAKSASVKIGDSL